MQYDRFQNIVIFLILLAFPGTVLAANRYVRASASGANNGTDWTNAWTTWGAISTTGMTSGDTVYIACGAYSGTGFGLSVAGLRVQLATVASHGTSTGWSDAFDDGTCQAVHDRNDNSSGNAQGNILANADNITIDGMRRYGIHVYGGYWAIGAFSGNYRADGLTVRNVEIGWPTTGADHVSEDCIQGRGDDLLLENNYFHDCNDPDTHGDCVQWYSSNSIIIRRNHFHNCGQGVMFGWDAQGEHIEAMDFSSNMITNDIDNPGLHFMSTQNCPTGAGTYRIYQNTFYTNVPRTGEPWNTGSIASLAGCGSSAVIFRNNALIRTRTDGITSTTHTHNAYDSSGADAACTGYPTCNPDSPTETGKVTAASLGIVSLNGASSDFNLTTDSVLRNAGTTGLGITTDWNGNAFGSPPSIGAFEFAEAGSAAPTVTITGPTSATTYATSTATLTTLAGTASDDIAVSSVTWGCPTCTPTSGSATGTTSWSVASIGLASGDNVITVTATDGESQTAQDTLTVTYTAVTGVSTILRLVR